MGGHADGQVAIHGSGHCRTHQRHRHHADDGKSDKQPRYGKTEFHY